MTYTLTNETQMNAQRTEILNRAPDQNALAGLVDEWSETIDFAITQVGHHIESYRGTQLRVLLDWADALSDAYFEPEHWLEYADFVAAAPTSITIEG